MSRTSFNRRAFLKGIGVSAAGLTLLPSTVTRAADPVPPKRLIAIFTPNGTIFDGWSTRGASETDFTLGPILEPLAPFKNKLLLLEGIDNLAAFDGPGGGHVKGTGALLTGRPLNDGTFEGAGGVAGWASGISIDQELANALGQDTLFPSLELGVQVEGATNRHRISYAGSDQPLPPEDNPSSVFERLFANFTTDTTQLAAIQRRNRRRQSVLDFVEADLVQLQQKLGKDEWENLEAHISAIREIEKRLQAPAIACNAPGKPAVLDYGSVDNYGATGTLQSDLLAAAFGCDLTRFATVIWGGAVSGKRFPSLGITDGHHNLSHNDSTQKDKLIKINNWYAQQIAHLLAKLDALPEANGSVLDNTIVFWGNELSIGSTHSRKDMHWVLAGGAGVFKMGRHLRYNAAPHNNLLVSIANALGHPITTFGGAQYCTGTLPNLS